MSSRPSYSESVEFSALSFGTMFVVGIASSVAIARIYGIDVIGENALSLAPVAVLAYLSTVREQAGLVRELVRLPPRAPQVTALFYVVLAFSSVLTLCVAVPVLVGTWFLFDGPIGRPDLFLPALVQTAGFLLFTNTSWNYDMVFSAFRAGKELFHVRLWQALSYLLIAIVLGSMSNSIWALVAAMVGSSFTALVHRFVFARRFMNVTAPRTEFGVARSALPSIIRYGAKIAPGVAFDGVAKESATWVLGAVAPVSAVGAFNRAALLGQRMSEANTRLGEMLFPTLIERHGATDQAGFGRSMVDTMRYATVGLALVAAAGGGAAHGVMDIFGAGFDEGATALALLLALAAVGSIGSCLLLTLYAVERLVITSVIGFARLVVLIPLMLILGSKFGVTGAALALVLASVGGLVWLIVAARAMLKPAMRRYWAARERCALALAYCGAFASARVLDHALTGTASTVVALFTGAVVYSCLFWMLGGINSRDRERFDVVQTRWRSRRISAGVP